MKEGRHTARVPGAAALACLAAVVLSGCAAPDQRAVQINDDAQFQSVVAGAGAGKPVLVMFYKEGCPACAAESGVLDQLATEYQGKAVIAKYMIFTFVYNVMSPELQERFGIRFMPHVVLLVNDQERTHWVGYKGIDTFRKELDAAMAAGPPAGPRPEPSTRPTAAASL
ncbi:MAG: thioredoxin family protein [Phycisphaerae bacterium]